MAAKPAYQRPPVPPPPPPRSRRLIWIAGFILVAAGAAGYWFWPRAEPVFPQFTRSAKQNVLLVTIDTLRADALGSYGGRAVTTNLDALARDGVRFTFAHAHAVMTLPSHASIMTGRYPYDHGVRDNAGFSLADPAVTLAELASQKGYATAAFVGAFPLDRQFGLSQGFGTYDDVGGRGSDADFLFHERPAGDVVTRARAWIETQQGPWFAWVHVFDPHAPYAPPPPFDTRYTGDPYAGEVAYVDRSLASLLDLVRARTTSTSVIVTADHGEALGDHDEATHGIFAYESTLKVPLILAQVGGGAPVRERGLVSDVPVRHVDILPTVADLIGLDLPANLPGRTLLTAYAGEAEPRPSYFESMTAMLKRGWAPLRGVLVDREKYIDVPIAELYDLETDPAERRNLAAAGGDRVRKMTAQLESFHAGLPGPESQVSAETRARLQSLGYASGAAPRKAQYTADDDPKNLIGIDRLMIQGIEWHRTGQVRQAIDAYRQVIARRPDMGLAYRRLAYIQWEAGATADAIATLRGALKKNGPDREIEVRLGTYLAETGNAAEAVSLLERVSTADPSDPEALNALGIAQARTGRTAQAIATFGRALTVNPRDTYALENLGTAHLQSENAAAAREAFERALAADPRSSRAHAGLGVIALRAGRQNEAIEHWRRAVEVDRTNYDALFNLATELVNAGRMPEARQYIQQFVRTAPRAIYGREIDRLGPLVK